MAITNPTKYVTTRRLGRFKEKLDTTYATKTELAEAVTPATDSEIQGLFT